MRKPLGKHVRNSFEAGLKRRLPEFQYLPKPNMEPRCRFYATQVAENLWFMIMLQINDKDDDFYIEIMAASEPKMPDATYLRNPLKQEEPYKLPIRFRLDRLWRRWSDSFELDPSPEDETGRRIFDPHKPWQGISVEDLVPRVEPLVESVLDKIMEYAVPFLEQVAVFNGVEWHPKKAET